MKKTEVECCDVTCVHNQIIEAVKEKMPAEELLLCVLLRSEMCVCDLAEMLGMTQSAISHQLRVLKQMKLVKNRREGKTVYYSLADGHIQNIISQGMEHIME